jgi:hypothetical protein
MSAACCGMPPGAEPAKSQSLKVSKSQSLKVSKSQSLKVSKSQSLKVSKSQSLKVSKSKSKFDVRCSMFDVRCSMFDVRCSMFDVRCSMFDVRCSMFDIRLARLRHTHTGFRGGSARCHAQAPALLDVNHPENPRKSLRRFSSWMPSFPACWPSALPNSVIPPATRSISPAVTGNANVPVGCRMKCQQAVAYGFFVGFLIRRADEDVSAPW